MSFPMGVDTVTLTKDYRQADGTAPHTVTVAITPSVRSVVVSPSLTIEPVPVHVTVSDGLLSVTVAATNGFSYEIAETVNGHPRTPFNVLTPSSGSVALDSLAPIEPVSLVYTPVRTVEGFPPDATGNIDLPPAQGADPAGTAAAAVAAHVAQLDPHPQYLTPTEANAVYATLAGLTAAIATRAVKPIMREGYVTSGDTNLNLGTSSWGVLPGFPTFSVPAAVGDKVGFDATILRQSNGNMLADIGVVVSGTIVRWLGAGTVTVPGAGYEGDPGLYHTPLPARSSERRFTVTLADLDAGNVVFAMLCRVTGAGSALILADSVNPFYWQATNYGVVA